MALRGGHVEAKVKPALSVVVQTCKARLEMANRQLELLRVLQVPGVEVIGLAVDENMEGPWASAKKAWAMGTGENHLVIQEDAVVCSDFLAIAKMLIGMRPERVYSFYLATGATELAQQQGKHWVEVKRILTGLAVAMPGWMATHFLAWQAEQEPNRPDWGKHDDSRTSDYFVKFGQRVLVPAPCLVQHDLTVRSTMGTGAQVGKNRREARWFIGARSPFSIDWELGFEQPVKG